MDGITWLKGLADELQHNNQNEAAKIIREAIGTNSGSEIGGIAKVIGDYAQENPLEGANVPIKLSVKLSTMVEPMEVEVSLGGNAIEQGITFGLLMTLFLSQGS